MKFIVPFPAATPPDMLARLAAQRLSDAWGTPVIVEVHDGAGGTIGLNQVLRSAPDGYTLLFTNDIPVVKAPVVSKTSFDPRKDLTPIAAVARGTSVLVVNPSIGIRSIEDLIAAAKARPGALTFASAGDTSTSRMCAELIKQSAGIDLMQVPYKGAAPAILATVTGEVSMFCSPVFQALPHIRSGKLLALGVTGTKPSSTIPEALPLSTQGLSDVVVSSWYAVFAKAGTSPAIVGQVRESLKKVFDDAGVRQKLSSAGLDPIWWDEVELGATIRSELETWARVAQRAGIKIE